MRPVHPFGGRGGRWHRRPERRPPMGQYFDPRPSFGTTRRCHRRRQRPSRGGGRRASRPARDRRSLSYGLHRTVRDPDRVRLRSGRLWVLPAARAAPADRETRRALDGTAGTCHRLRGSAADLPERRGSWNPAGGLSVGAARRTPRTVSPSPSGTRRARPPEAEAPTRRTRTDGGEWSADRDRGTDRHERGSLRGSPTQPRWDDTYTGRSAPVDSGGEET